MNFHAMKMMKKEHLSFQTMLATVLLGALLFAAPSFAGPGHDHGDEAPIAVGNNSPRVVMESELFEVVGILKDRMLEIYVDHAATNAPVQNAKLELELNGQQVPVELHSEGEFAAMLPEGIEEGTVAVALTVSAGDEIDLLAGELLLNPHGEHSHDEESHMHLSNMVTYSIGGLLIFALIVFASLLFKLKRNH